jgi:hypothetical protein
MDLWNTETAICDIPGLDIDVPDWIVPDISPNDVAAIVQGGCASGAYMPAVTYYDALKTMAEHGDEVLDYIEGAAGELPDISGQGWSQMATTYLSCAVEIWACGIEGTLEDYEPEEEAQPEEAATP